MLAVLARLWLLTALGLGQAQGDFVLLAHDVEHEVTTRFDDSGSSSHCRYAIESQDVVLYVYAEAADADLALSGTVEGPLASRVSERFEDDDSGGGTTPFLRVEHRGEGTLLVRVTAKDIEASTTVTVYCYEARESTETRAAAAAAEAAVDECLELTRAGNLAQARSRLAKAFEALREVDGQARSPAIQEVVRSIGVGAEHLGVVSLNRAARGETYSFLSRTHPANHPDLQKTRQNLASAMFLQGEVDEATGLLQQVLEVYSRTLPPEHPDLQTARSNLAAALWTLGDLDGARPLFKSALEVQTRTLPADDESLQMTRLNYAALLFTQGDLEAAEALFRSVIDVFSRTLHRTHPDLQGTRLNLASTLFQQGRHEEARVLFVDILEILSKSLPSDHPDLVRTRANLASILKVQGDSQGARVMQERALAILTAKLPDDHPEVQANRLNLSATLGALGDLDGARALLERVLEVQSQTLPEGHQDLQRTRLYLAVNLMHQGELADARPLAQRVLELRSESLPPDHVDVLDAKAVLATILSGQGDLQAARELQEDVLDVRSRDLPDGHPYTERARANLATTLMGMGDPESARAQFEHVLAVRRRSLPEDHPDLRAARWSTARARALSGDARGSRELARELATSGAAGGDSAASLWATPLLDERVIDTVLSISAGAGAFEADAETERQAFTMVERVRGDTRVAARLSRVLEAAPEAARIREEIATATRELSQLVGGPESENPVRFSGLVRERDALRRELLSRLPEEDLDGCLPDRRPEAIARRLAPDEVALGYWRYQRWLVDAERGTEKTVPSYLVWVIHPGGALRRVELGDAGAIEIAVRNLRAALEQGGPSRAPLGVGVASDRQPDAVHEHARAVAALLVDPVREWIEDARRLWIAPADALHLVPFGVLPMHDGLLGDRLEVVVQSALSERTLEPEELLEPGLLSMGGMDYDATPHPSPDDVESRTPGPRGVSVHSLGPSERNSVGTFRPLPAAAEEASRVRELFVSSFEDVGGSEFGVHSLSGPSATRDAFEVLAPRSRYIHLATHGWFAPESVASTMDGRLIDERMHVRASSLGDQVRGLAPSLLCGVAFAGANREADQMGRVRNIMTAEEIAAMNLSGVELCVLSACETNVGMRRGGQGIASLQAALHAAGARTAVTSLWKVPDEATRELMNEFYRRLWVLEEPKARALWNAKKKLRKSVDADGAHVYSTRDWAGWVLSGDPD